MDPCERFFSRQGVTQNPFVDARVPLLGHTAITGSHQAVIYFVINYLSSSLARNKQVLLVSIELRLNFKPKQGDYDFTTLSHVKYKSEMTRKLHTYQF